MLDIELYRSCRVLYMPSIGFCLLVAVGARKLAAACPKVSTAFCMDKQRKVN